jgi:hypothetical protein
MNGWQPLQQRSRLQDFRAQFGCRRRLPTAAQAPAGIVRLQLHMPIGVARQIGLANVLLALLTAQHDTLIGAVVGRVGE